MSRSPKKSFSKTFNTKSRGSYIDYEYLDKLSLEEQKWLAQFTDEYYGAGFKINSTFVKKKDFIEQMLTMIDTETNDKKKVKFTEQLEYYRNIKEVYLQISGHSQKTLNVDLRKMRSITKYYKTPGGKLSSLPKYKYSDENIQIDTNMKDCNDRANSIRVDAFSRWYRNELFTEDSKVDKLLDICTSESLDINNVVALIVNTDIHNFDKNNIDVDQILSLCLNDTISHEDKILLMEKAEEIQRIRELE